MLHASATFARRCPGPLTADQRAIIERLERQRHRCGRVRAWVHDPDGRHIPLLARYISYCRSISQVLAPTSLLCVHSRAHAAAILGDRSLRRRDITVATLRRPHICGTLHHALILAAHTFSPCLPRHRSKVDSIMRTVIGSCPGRHDTVIILHGDFLGTGPRRRSRNALLRSTFHPPIAPDSAWTLIDPKVPLPQEPPPPEYQPMYRIAALPLPAVRLPGRCRRAPCEAAATESPLLFHD